MRSKALCLLAVICMLLSACGGGKEPTLKGNELLAIGRHVCTWEEAQIFLLSQYKRYTGDYGPGIWAVEMEEGNFEGYIKKELLEYLKLLFLADYGAELDQVKLSEAEQAAVNQAAQSFIRDLGPEGVAKTGINEEVARGAYARFARAQIFYRQTMIDGQLEVSDEEARVISLQIIEMEQRVGYNQSREIQTELIEGKAVGEAIRNIEGITARKENIARGDLPQELEAIAFSLKSGQWSPIITLGTKYYLMQCLSPSVKEETAKNKANMERQAREDNLNKVLAELAAMVQLIYNPDLWNSWTMEQFDQLPAVDFYRYSGPLEK